MRFKPFLLALVLGIVGWWAFSPIHMWSVRGFIGYVAFASIGAIIWHESERHP